MKKWVIILLFVLIIPIIAIIYLYQTALSSKQVGIDAARERVQHVLNESAIKDVDYYYGKEVYFVFQGKNKQKEDIIVWVPKDKESDVVIKKRNEGLSEEQVMTQVQRESKPKEIKSATLGMENDVPLWEVKYVRNDGAFCYEYLHFESGELMKRYVLFN